MNNNNEILDEKDKAEIVSLVEAASPVKLNRHQRRTLEVLMRKEDAKMRKEAAYFMRKNHEKA